MRSSAQRQAGPSCIINQGRTARYYPGERGRSRYLVRERDPSPGPPAGWYSVTQRNAEVEPATAALRMSNVSLVLLRIF